MATLRSNAELRRLKFEAWKCMRFIPVFYLVIIVLALGGTAIGEAAAGSSYHDAQKARIRLNNAMSEKVPIADRKTEAIGLIRLHAQGVKSDLNDGARGKTNLKSEVAALQVVAKTGQPLALDVHNFEWVAFRLVLHAIPMALIGMLFVLFTNFLPTSRKRQQRWFIVDVRWREVWPVLFFVVTPFAWPIYLISAYRLKKEFDRVNGERPPDPEPAARDYYGYDPYYDDLYPYRRRRHNTPATPVAAPKKEEVKFKNDPTNAASRYIALRTDAWRSSTIERLADLRAQKVVFTDRMRSFGDSLRDMQNKRNEVEAEIRQLETVDVDKEKPDMVNIRAEFDRLLSLPGITSIHVADGDICLLLEARLEYDGHRYDLGDWELRFGEQTGLLSNELRSGVRPDWEGSYPVYRIGEDHFCFGVRQDTITRNLMKGQYLEAIELAVDCIQSVNEEDQHNISRAFYLEEVSSK